MRPRRDVRSEEHLDRDDASWENRSTPSWSTNRSTPITLFEPGCIRRDEILAVHDADCDRVVGSLLGPVPAGVRVFYQKHMTHHLLPDMDRTWMESVVNCFLIRDPRSMVASLHARTPNPSIEDTGLPQQRAIFDEVHARTGVVPPVLDASDVLSDPRGVLGRCCDAVGVEFDEAMLSWPAGSRDSDGAWAPWWYDSVEASTGFDALPAAVDARGTGVAGGGVP